MSGSTSLLDSLQPVTSAPPAMAASAPTNATSTLDSLSPAQPTPGMIAAGIATTSKPPVPTLPDWAYRDHPRSSDLLNQEVRAAPESSWSNIAGALPSGLYEGVARVANLPTTLLNAGKNLIRNFGGDVPKEDLQPPINENPTNYQPNDQWAAGVRDVSSAVAQTAATGGLAKVVTPLLPVGSTAQAITEGLSNTSPKVLTAAGAGAAAEQPIAERVPIEWQPEARLAANLAAGGLTLGAENGVANAARGGINYEDAALAQLARDQYNIPIRWGQLSENRIVRNADSSLRSVPFSGMKDVDAEQNDSWRQQVSQTFGQDSTKITPSVIDNAYRTIGPVFENIGGKYDTPLDQTLQTKLANVYQTAGEVGLDAGQVAAVRGQIDKIWNIAAQNNGAIPGDVYVNLTKRGESLDLLSRSRSTTAGNLGGQIRDALDEALQRNASPDDAAALNQARAQYKALKTVEPLTMRADVNGGETPSTGEIKPSDLLSRVNQQYPNAARAQPGQIPLLDLARIGQRFLKETNTSQTSERGNLFHGLRRVGETGGAIAGAMVGGEHYAGLSPLEMIAPVAVGVPTSLAAANVAGRVLKSEGMANRAIKRGLQGTPPQPTLTQQAVPLMTTGGIRALEPPDAQPPASLTSINPATGLPEFNLKANQETAASAVADPQQIAARMVGGTLADHKALGDWINQNKRQLRMQFGGQGIQNITQIGALVRRASIEQTPSTVFSALLKGAAPDVLAMAGDAASLVAKAIASPDLAKILATKSKGAITKIGQNRLVALLSASDGSSSGGISDLRAGSANRTSGGAADSGGGRRNDSGAGLDLEVGTGIANAAGANGSALPSNPPKVPQNRLAAQVGI